MVTFELDPESRRIVKEVADFVESEVLPLEEKFNEVLRHEGQLIKPDGTLSDEAIRLSREIRRKSGKNGYYGMHMPEEVGGRGMPSTAMLRAYKEVYRRGGYGLNLAVLAQLEGPSRMHLAMTEAQREKYLAPLMRGEKTTCFALTEPHAGSDARNIRTHAVLDGDEWVLNGEKWFITNGPYADFALVFAKTADDPADNDLGSISVFIVDGDAPGFRRGDINETIANNGLPCKLHFEDCRVPKENILGDVGEGLFHALRSINDTRVLLGGMSVGMAQYCLDTAVDYTRQREAFGKPISKFQGVSFPLADAATELKAAEMLALHTAWLIDQGEDPIQETSMTKLFCTEMLWNVADRCVGAMGGHGTLREYRVERVLRWARVMRVFEGSNEIQRQTIAKTMGL